MALILAESEKKPMVGGSDRHNANNYLDINSGILLKEKVYDIHALIEAIKAGKSSVIGIERLNSVTDNLTPALPAISI